MPEKVDESFSDSLTAMDFVYLGGLLENICVLEDGVGLSAFQVGIPIPFFVASDDGKNFEYYFNAEYKGASEKTQSIEGCLSIKNDCGQPRRFLLERYIAIKLKCQKIICSNPIRIENIDQYLIGLIAIIIQHESDHHKGILINKIGKEIRII